MPTASRLSNVRVGPQRLRIAGRFDRDLKFASRGFFDQTLDHVTRAIGAYASAQEDSLKERLPAISDDAPIKDICTVAEQIQPQR